MIKRIYHTMIFFLIAVVLSSMMGSPLGASTSGYEPLMRITIESSDPKALESDLMNKGYDVVGILWDSSSIDVIVSQNELDILESEGFVISNFDYGRPLSEILKEDAMGAEMAVPPANYKNLATILSEMNSVASNYSSIAKVVNLTTTLGTPKTAEGRDMYAMKISDNVNTKEDEPSVMIVGNHHARELVTPVIALYAIDQLTSKYASDPQIKNIVDNNEIWIAPVWNPDGYTYVFTTDNMWRKNRRQVSGAVGVDLNRNYPHGWSNSCSGDSNTSSNTYKGPSPASEAESKTMMELSKREHFVKVLDYHSQGQYVLFQYPPNCDSHPHFDWLKQKGVEFSQSSGYSGTGNVSASGEHFQWQMARGAFSFLAETAREFQPPYITAQSETKKVWPGILWMLEHELPISGKVTDVTSGSAIEDVTVEVANVNFTAGEIFKTGTMGEYSFFFPNGTYTLKFTKTGYTAQEKSVTVSAGFPKVVNVQLSSGNPQQYQLTVNNAGTGMGSVTLNPSGGLYNSGTVVELTATSNTGSAFDGWSGDLSGTQNPVSITMNSNKTVTVTFSKEGGTDYCASNGKKTIDEWIQKVDVGSFSNPSNASVVGYEDFTTKIVTVNKGTSIPVTLTPGFKSNIYSEHWKVWIDFNQNKSFEDSGEMVFYSSGTAAVSGNVAIPSSVMSGDTRMRISMKYNAVPTSCESFEWGEVEDYTVRVEGQSTNQPPKADFIHTKNQLSVTFRDQSSDADGSIASWAWDFGDGQSSTQQNPSHNYGAEGTYTLKLTVTDNAGASNIHSDAVVLGSTPPPPYCDAKGTDFSYEWISDVSFGNFTNPSGKEGYGDFTAKVISISKGTSINVGLTPGFASSTYAEHFRVWIDLNGDGDFADAGETVFEKAGNSKVSGTFTIPISAKTGETRLRVAMQDNKYVGPCDTFQYGEVEDYTVDLK